jgi:hypothetical protein
VKPARSERERRLRNLAFAELARRGMPIDPAGLAARVAELVDDPARLSEVVARRRPGIVVRTVATVPVAGSPAGVA